MSTIIVIILIILLLGRGGYGYTTGWGYGPTGGIGLIVLILIVLLVLGRIKWTGGWPPRTTSRPLTSPRIAIVLFTFLTGGRSGFTLLLVTQTASR